MSPFAQRDDITAVEAIPGTGDLARPEGAVITFRAVPGMTAEWLQRVVDCHLARNAALGHDVPEMAFCPLVPKNVSAKVTATGAGFTVAVRSSDEAAAREIVKRSSGLTRR